MAEQNREILKVEHLKKYFPVPNGMLHAVDDISFTIEQGKTLGVVGESGCGKSTMGRAILRLHEPTSGKVYFDQKDILSFNDKQMKDMRRDMQIIFQDPFASLNPRMTVSEAIAAPLLVQKIYDHKDKDGIAQEVMFADANTFLSYNQNMRQLTVDKLAGAELVVFNRMAPGTDVMEYHKIARAVNRRINILYEYTDGTTKQDDIEDPLPFDLNAPVVKIEDEDYALFYRDITEEPDKYKGKTVEFKGQVARLRKEKEGMFAPGRFVMTCCEADITFMGLPCRFVGAEGLKARSWVMVKAEVEVRYHSLYRGVGPILNAISISPAVPAEQQVATF